MLFRSSVRLGHVDIKFYAALIGSRIAFEFQLLKSELKKINAVGGFDRALELTMFKLKKKIGYIDDLFVLDEKIQTYDDFSRQRRRWMSAQIHYFNEFVFDLPKQILKGNKDFVDKLFQQISLPRLMLLGLNIILCIITTIFFSALSYKWWCLLLILNISLLIAIPRKFYNIRFFVALSKIPIVFMLMMLNLFKLKGANKTFIHTKHGVK